MCTHHHDGRFHAATIPVAAACLLIAGCTAAFSGHARILPVEAYQIPPFSELTLAVPPADTNWTLASSTLPPASVAVCTWAGPGALAQFSPASTLRCTVGQPTRTVLLDASREVVGLKGEHATVSLRTSVADGSISVAGFTSRFERVVHAQVATVSQTATGVARRTSFREGTVSTNRMGTSMTATNRTEGITSLGATPQVSTFSARSGLYTVDAMGGMTHTYLAGNLQSLIDEGFLQMLDDADLMSLLMDESLLDGFYTADGISVMRDTFEIPLLEDAAIETLLMKFGSDRGALRDLIERPCTALFRTNAPAAGSLTADISASLVTTQGVYHGHEILVNITLKNMGTNSLCDPIVFYKMPEHTIFSRFPPIKQSRRGYLRFHMPSYQVVCWKLYEPLQPGASFKANLLLRIHPWDPNEYTPPAAPRSRAAPRGR